MGLAELCLTGTFGWLGACAYTKDCCTEKLIATTRAIRASEAGDTTLQPAVCTRHSVRGRSEAAVWAMRRSGKRAYRRGTRASKTSEKPGITTLRTEGIAIRTDSDGNAR